MQQKRRCCYYPISCRRTLWASHWTHSSGRTTTPPRNTCTHATSFLQKLCVNAILDATLDFLITMSRAFLRNSVTTNLRTFRLLHDRSVSLTFMSARVLIITLIRSSTLHLLSTMMNTSITDSSVREPNVASPSPLRRSQIRGGVSLLILSLVALGPN